MEFEWFRGPKAVCFAHMQKSGGSSAFQFIYEHASRDHGWKGEHYLRIWCSEFVPKHIDGIRAGQFRFVYGHFDPTPLFDHFSGVYFTLVRDPVERVISLYNFCATMDDETLGGITGVQSPDFAHLTPAIYSLSDDMQSMIAAVRGGLSFADFIRLPPELFGGLEAGAATCPTCRRADRLRNTPGAST